MKSLYLIILTIVTFSSNLSLATYTVGKVLGANGDTLILDTDLPERSAKGVGVLMVGHAIDYLAVRLGKYEMVPRYRISRVMQGIMAFNRESQDENADLVVKRIVERLKDSCKTAEPCTFKLTMKSSDWLKPVPNYGAPASEKDIQFYDADFFKSYYQNDIQNYIDALNKIGKVSIFGQAFGRDPTKGPMSPIEIQDLKVSLINLYQSNYISNHFVKTRMGTFRAEPVRNEFHNFPWPDVVIRSKNFPQNYQQLLGIVQEGMNRSYLSQKREEIFMQALAFKGGKLKDALEFLLDQITFLPIKQNDNPDSIADIKNYKQIFLESVDQLIKEKTEMAALYIVKQSVMALMEGKESL